jgi:hypothetical protein
MSLLSTSLRVKKSLNEKSSGPRVASPLMIHHAVDSVEVNMATNDDVTADMFFQEVTAKERELLYQQAILEGCRDELALLRENLKEETDPKARGELMETARRFALALHGKKERFLTSYGEWKSSMLSLDQDLLKDSPTCVPENKP